MFREEGLEVMYGRHALLARIAREGVITLGCRLLAPDAPGTSVTGFFPPDQVSADTLRTEVRKRFGIRLAGGQGKFKGAVVRIGHMGHVDPFEVMNTVLAIGMTARALGAKVDLEGASKVCLQLLAQ
jgi:aspartate aminotransferase-like enzyme